MKKYKVEMKPTLWEVTLQEGAYSDWRIYHYLFTGNDESEVWEQVKIWASDGGLSEMDDYKKGLVWGTQQHQYQEDADMDWSTDYGNAYRVDISRAHVIYVNT